MAQNGMSKAEARKILAGLADRYLPDGWRVELQNANHGRAPLGWDGAVCDIPNKTIHVRYQRVTTIHEMTRTFAHELAHARLPAGEWHSDAWVSTFKATCSELSVDYIPYFLKGGEVECGR